MTVLAHTMLRVEGGYWDVLDGVIHIGDAGNFRRRSHDVFHGSLHCSSRSGEPTYRQWVSSAGQKYNLMKIVVSKGEWVTSTDYSEMS